MLNTRRLIAAFVPLAQASLSGGLEPRAITLTFGRLHAWVSRHQGWMKLRLKVFTQGDAVSCPWKISKGENCGIFSCIKYPNFEGPKRR